ncbi:MAG TPA: hypothetical protein DDX89_01335 [Candidatus Omnitrophica bacterium]|nr:MAG: hypothetical protein A2Z92_06755 [Omnitrophica WOR_2 bacterium GWA2_63_20]OGX33135.1 MAG: hypothetical protein A3E56_02245 [Omnitrophica WOR_2 bacterium RIFCSPHIGHO2_12_FULL_64_13]OGX46513.1 MAG: hypothetical protein A3I71_04920 [Omnitrophica WOR_2 bacterium RIFCSPLOWO2_02_FULL_63_16]OGX47484.1 MAG: hypothetical protein A3G88_00415 [Omnitrophica WOR_2 bacterium RIFCSPLOWO2_12_FULL_63_16]HAM39925.1 hypothetical protein [Candidatus Omnitrophota bacterium]
MGQEIPLSNGVGEVMAPQTLVTAFVIAPDGSIRLDAGALHGRSQIEGQVTMVSRQELAGESQPVLVVWVALELDGANRPVRYKGLSVCQILVNSKQQMGYKSLSEHVNRMGEAIRGDINIARLSPEQRRAVKQQLVALGASFWDASDPVLKQALES